MRFLIIPAAGLGRRMKDVDPDIPKEMLPIGDVPAIAYCLEEGLSIGVEEIVVIINKDKEMIREYLESRKNTNVRFTFLYQDKPTGESNAIFLAKDIVGKNPMAIIYPDNIYFPSPGALRKLSEVYDEFQTDVGALTAVDEESAKGLGNSGHVALKPIKKDIFQIKKIHPKGPGTFKPRQPGQLRACGFRIATPDLFDSISRARPKVKSGEFTDGPVTELVLKERQILACRLAGRVFDIGIPEGYEMCCRFVLRQKSLLRS